MATVCSAWYKGIWLYLTIFLFTVTPIFASDTIKIGVLNSFSGTMQESETPVANAVELAVEEINADGGLLGKKIQIITADGKSDPTVFAKEAEKLIVQNNVQAIFGCWTSASRKSVKQVVEKYDNLLFYPVQYEGLEASGNIFYMGLTANQQIFPTLKWASAKFGHKFFLVGSDYVFPRTANMIIKDAALFYDSNVVGEKYLPLGSRDMNAIKNIVDEIVKTKPDVILNTINGDTNKYFFAELAKRGLINIPIISFSMAENEMVAFNGAVMTNHYAVWSYFQSDEDSQNIEFVKAYKAKFGQNKTVDDPMKTAYASVYMWASAVKEAGKTEPKLINRTMLKQSMKAPGGIMAIDIDTRHVWQFVKIAKVEPNGQFKIVYQTPKLIRPNPYPLYKSQKEWQKAIDVPKSEKK